MHHWAEPVLALNEVLRLIRIALGRLPICEETLDALGNLLSVPGSHKKASRFVLHNLWHTTDAGCDRGLATVGAGEVVLGVDDWN